MVLPMVCGPSDRGVSGRWKSPYVSALSPPQSRRCRRPPPASPSRRAACRSVLPLNECQLESFGGGDDRIKQCRGVDAVHDVGLKFPELRADARHTIGRTSPFGLFLCRIYAQAAVDDALREAARIDEAGELLIFHAVGLRLLAPALMTVLLFQLVGNWNNCFLPLVMLPTKICIPLRSVSTIDSQVNRLPEIYQLTTGGVLLSIIPLRISTIVLQRFWQGGLTEGAVK